MQVGLASALVMVEAGYPARVAGALERAEATPGFHAEPASRALSQILHAQMLLLDGMGAAAVRASLEGLGSLPPDTAGSSLAAYAHLTAAECLLASEDASGAAVYLDRIAGSPGRTGLLAARAEVLQARIELTRGRLGSEAIRVILDKALARLERLGAPRELALAYIVYAHAVAVDGADVSVTWLARAQPLLVKAGTAGDLRQLRQAFRAFGRRKIDRIIDSDAFSVMEALRERHARLRDILSAQRDARVSGSYPLAAVPSPLAKVVDESLEAVHLAEEALIGAMEHTLLDRERISQLVTVSQQLSSLENLEDLLGAIPRLAMMLLPTMGVGLVEVDAAGGLGALPGGAALDVSSLEEVRQSIVSALQANTLQIIKNETRGTQSPRSHERSAGGRYAVVPLPGAGRYLGLLVGTAEHQGPLSECDLEQLAVFGSLSSAALARASSGAALRQAAARDAATLAAIRDGILTLDEERIVRAINQAALRLLRIGQEQVLGRRLLDVSALAPLGEVLRAEKPLTDEIVALAHGDLLVRSHLYKGGTIVTLQELASVQRLAHKLVGSQARFSFEELIGQDPAFLACLEDARLAARSDVPILITGESGTGKELLAQAIHRASPKAGFSFVGINVAALPRELLESELFGYERGAFTGARAGGNPGKFELADRGTILLDEIGDMPLEMQVKLLRVLQERVFQRLGGSRDIPLLARIIATTHQDLEVAVGVGAFRLDLFHRLRVVHLRLPALRERRGDIPQLVGHHLQRYALRLGRRPIQVAPHVMAALESYDWPGNVRELANLLEGAASLLPDEQDVITRIPPVVERALRHRGAPASRGSSCSFLVPDRVLPFGEVERNVFEHALRHCAGNVAQAAKALGVAKGTFYSKIRRYGLMAQEPGEATEQGRGDSQGYGATVPLTGSGRTGPSSRKLRSPSS